MLSSLRLRDYKSYRGETDVPLRRISVLLGKNNSGKTAVARLPLLLVSALGRRSGRWKQPIPRSARGLEYGSGPLELVHGKSPHFGFGLGCTIRLDATHPEVTLSVDVQLRQTLATGITSFVADFGAMPLLPPIRWNRDLNSDDVGYDDLSVLGFDGVLPQYVDNVRRQIVDDIRRGSGEALDELVHLTSLRRPLLSVYENRSREGEFDPTGGDAPYLLNESDELLAKVTHWYERCLDTRIELVQETAAFRLVSVRRSGGDHSLARAGQGIQQVLPVVTHLRAMTLGVGPRFLVVEEPELNLHPAAHGDLADLVVDASMAKRGGQLLVETHSENFVLRLRYHVATGRLNPADVNLLWFQHHDDCTTVREIHINTDGSVTDWPTGVFSEDLVEVRAIAKETRC